ncbi:TonB-dependent receptor [Sphingomonas sp. BN140010]|uniref:TonB-dependent receptor n=1 Tax=Sphingomonas arvum TaxID=2992113 RepID=A0ABT3JGX0_9SPHN|nr:TonB-dependent receptor [Sphingomonas sp. BN140010]MCW3798199.1 TonB-dependent receptor [Sphingomonas sp. BN140010]
MIDLPPPSSPAATEIVVTGRALGTSAGERLLRPMVIDARELAETPATGLDQLLTGLAGVQLFRRSDARSANPTSQGVTLRALGGNAASRTLLVLDGVPQVDPFGGWVPWPAYDPAGLAEVRVTRGGGSVTAGPGALAGVVELTSRADLGLRGEAEAGSRESFNAAVGAGMKTGGGLLTVSAQAARGDGFMPVVAEDRGPADRRAPYRNAAARLRWVAPVGGEAELQAGLSAFTDHRTRGLAFTGNKADGADASLRLVGRGALPFALLAYGQWRGFENSSASVTAGRTEARRSALQYDVPSRAFGSSAELRPLVASGVELRIGGDMRAMRGFSNEFGSYASGAPTRDRRSGGRSGQAGLFVEATRTEGPLVLSVAARLDRWWIGNGVYAERNLLSGAALQDLRYPARHGWRPTGRAGAALDLTGGWSVSGAAYLGWRLPTLNELFRPFRAGSDATAANPLLKPERLRGAEATLAWATGPWSLSATAFANRLIDPVVNVTLASGPGSFAQIGFVGAGGSYRQRQNLDAVTSRGLELASEWRRGPWRARLSASLAAAEVSASRAAAALDGLRPAQTPRTSVGGSLGWSQDGTFGNLSVRSTGAQFEDDLNSLRLAGGTQVDLAAGLPLSSRLQLTTRVENLLDANILAATSSDGVRERITPRTLWVGLRLR